MPGLLDYYSDPRQQAMLGLSAGLLSAGGPSARPVGFGQALGQGLLTGSTMFNQARQLQGLEQQRQMQQAALAQQLQQRALQQQIAQRLLAGGALGPGAPSGLPGALGMAPGGAQGLSAPSGLPAAPGAPGLGQSQGQGVGSGSELPFSLQEIAAMRMAGLPDLTPAYTAGRPTTEQRNLSAAGVDPRSPEGRAMLAGPAYAELIKMKNAPATIRIPGTTIDVPTTQSVANAFNTGVAPDEQTAMQAMKIAGAYGIQKRIGVGQLWEEAFPQSGDAPRSVAPLSAEETEARKARATSAAQATGQAEVKGSPGQQGVDENFAKSYAEFNAAGGFADAEKNVMQLRGALTALQTEKNISGPGIGLTPDKVLRIANPRAYSVKQQIEEVVQRNLRLILGPQFTEREGIRLISRAYDDGLPQEENSARIERLLAAMQAGLTAKQDAARYFEANGTLRGWGGKLPTVNDFMESVSPTKKSGAKSGAESVPQGVDPRLWDVMPEKDRALWQK